MVLIPYSSGMGVGRTSSPATSDSSCLNTLFVRYGCGTAVEQIEALLGEVLIPYSSGMGVRQGDVEYHPFAVCLNTLFVRYGCGTVSHLETLAEARS